MRGVIALPFFVAMICPLTTNRGRTRINPADEAAIRLILLFVVIAGAVLFLVGEGAVSFEVGDVVNSFCLYGPDGSTVYG